MNSDKSRTVIAAKAEAPSRLTLHWSDGTIVTLDMANVLKDRAFRGLKDPAAFDAAAVGEWGHSVEWRTGETLSADALWLETLSAVGKPDARAFLEWRTRHGLSLSRAAEALGLSRRMIAYYSNGEKPVPRAVLLACRGWEADQAA